VAGAVTEVRVDAGIVGASPKTKKQTSDSDLDNGFRDTYKEF
jgi:hypothetical protein